MSHAQEREQRSKENTQHLGNHLSLDSALTPCHVTYIFVYLFISYSTIVFLFFQLYCRRCVKHQAWPDLGHDDKLSSAMCVSCVP